MPWEEQSGFIPAFPPPLPHVHPLCPYYHPHVLPPLPGVPGPPTPCGAATSSQLSSASVLPQTCRRGVA